MSLVRPALLVLVPLGIGVLARRLKLLRPAFRGIYLLVLWAVLPALVFGAVAIKQSGSLSILGGAAALAFIGLGATSVLSAVTTHAAKMDRKKSIAIFLNASFMNYAFLGLAVVAVVNVDWLGAASIYAVSMGVMHLTVGVALAASGSKKRASPRSVTLSILTFPAAFALIVALLFVGFGVGFPVAAQSWVDKFTYPAVILMLLAAGYQMPLVNPRKHLPSLAMVGGIRLVACPIITYFAIALSGLDPAGAVARSALLLSCMPPGVFNLILAQKFKLDLRMYGALVFYPTLVSLFVAVPLVVFLGIV